MSFFSLANAGVQLLEPYVPGKPTDELERELGIQNIVKLASNENPLGASPKALSAIQSMIHTVNIYPDGNGYRLKKALVEKFGLAIEGITLGNGSNDILELIVRGFVTEKDEVVISQHAFAVYHLASQSVNATIRTVLAKNYGCDLEAMSAAITQKTKVVFLTNPNNPTGTWFSRGDFEAFMQKVPKHILVVLDEAYCEYIDEPSFPNGLAYISQYENLIVTRTFSKIYGLAGLRVGYGVSHAEVANILNRVRQPFNVNQVALHAAEAALSDDAFISQSKALNQSGLRQLEAGLHALGFSYIPSLGNFICFDVKHPAMPLYQALLRKGVIVRPVANYQLPTFLRVTVGTTAQNQFFLEALAAVMVAY
jgi:histidinol-phosphate aminotransferase